MLASGSIAANEVEGESTTVPNWLELPREITVKILQRLDTIDIVKSACQVCPQWWNICKNPLVWHTIRMTGIDFVTCNYLDMEKICCYAVERSCGHLIGIEIESFCSDGLLECVAENASNLRVMRLANCWRILDKGFIEVARKFTELEELYISPCNLSKISLEVLSKSCPHLKSLTFARKWYAGIACDDDEALIIAYTMPGLRHLNIKGNVLSNVGLLAILDGCPLLESLDIQECYYLNFSVSLRKRCRAQIKDLKLPVPTMLSHEDDNHDNYVTYLDSLLDYDYYDDFYRE